MNRMMVLAVVTALAVACTARANASRLPNVSAAFGNTIIVTDPDGRSRKIWLAPDGSWTGLSRRGLDLAGRWAVRDDKVCMTQLKPRLFGSLCQRIPNKLQMDVEANDPAGKTVHVKLVPGHVEQ